jgi:hypothetical protein
MEKLKSFSLSNTKSGMFKKKTSLLFITMFVIGFWSCKSETKEPAPVQDEIDKNGGLISKVAGQDWTPTETKAYKDVFNFFVVRGRTPYTGNGNLDYNTQLQISLPPDTKIGTEYKIGKGIVLPNILFSSNDVNFKVGTWDSRDGESSGTIKITTLSSTEILGTFSGTFWDMNNNRISNYAINSKEFAGGKFKLKF